MRTRRSVQKKDFKTINKKWKKLKKKNFENVMPNTSLRIKQDMSALKIGIQRMYEETEKTVVNEIHNKTEKKCEIMRNKFKKKSEDQTTNKHLKEEFQITKEEITNFIRKEIKSALNDMPLTMKENISILNRKMET